MIIKLQGGAFMPRSSAVSIEDIRDAHRVLREKEVAWPTPIVREPGISEECGCEVYLKLENFQQTGSYKVRGAFNCMWRALEGGHVPPGFVTASAGNHAQGVALAARKLGLASKTHVFMHGKAPLTKLKKTLSHGVVVHLVGSSYQVAREASESFANSPAAFLEQGEHVYVPTTRDLEECKELARAGVTVHVFGGTSGEAEAIKKQCFEMSKPLLIPAFDDWDVIAGQGTVGLEILEQMPKVDAIVVPVGGGGLLSGIATVVTELAPHVEVIAVQAEETAAMIRALSEGKVVSISLEKPKGGGDLYADGINVQRVGQKTFDVVQSLSRRIRFCTANQGDVEIGIFALWDGLRLRAEGAGAIGVSLFLGGDGEVQDDRVARFSEDRESLVRSLMGKNVVVVVTGGNIDDERLKEIRESVTRYEEDYDRRNGYRN